MGHSVTAVRHFRSWALAPWLVFALIPSTAWSWSEIPDLLDPATTPDGIHVLDGSYVLDHGLFHVNITNHGLIGSQFLSSTSYSHAPSAQWPGGSGHEYLWAGGLWVGATKNGQHVVTTGQYQRELRPDDDILDTIYESIGNRVRRPVAAAQAQGRRLPASGADDDDDGTYDEDWLNGRDDDGDGLVDEDFGQIGGQMFTCVMHDDLPLIRELYPDHVPLGIKVIQRAAAWDDPDYQNMVALDFEIFNSSSQPLDEVYLGFFADFEIQDLTEHNDPNDIAGFYSGAVRAENGTFFRVNMAYALDGAEEDPLPGCIGLMQIHHPTDFLDEKAPHVQKVNAFRIFTAGGQPNQGAEPTLDQDRYEAMSRPQHDPNLRPDEAADVKVLISCGPFNQVQPRESLQYHLALIMGEGLEGALETAVHAAHMGQGAYFDFDHDYTTGGVGKETKVCIEDYPESSNGRSILLGYRSDFMDESCAGSSPVFGIPAIGTNDFYIDEDGRHCIWVNADNCDECFRAVGMECTEENNYFWSLYGGYNRWVMTGSFGGEHHLPWVVPREMPPPNPNARVVPGDRQVEVFWDDSSEHERDPRTGLLDFEAYEVWEATHWIRPQGVNEAQTPPTGAWRLTQRMDIVNFVPAAVGHTLHDQPLGMNTGLEDWIYTPVCLGDPRFAGLDSLMRILVESDITGQYAVMPPLRDFTGSVIPGLEPFIPWETFPDVLDTFFAVTPRDADPGPGVSKRSVRYYHLLREDLPNGFPLFMNVTAMDHSYGRDANQNLVPNGYGLAGEPANGALPVTPRPEAQTPQLRREEGNNIYVYPNPATREALAEFHGQYPSLDDPTGVRICFNNLPEAHNTIRIFTAAGDLIETIRHDGYAEGGQAFWNLMTRNGQEVVSGIYLFSVHSDKSVFDEYRGRFVIIR